MATRFLVGLLLALAIACVDAGLPTGAPFGKRTLVILDDWSLISSHSKFFQSLADRDYELDYKRAGDSKLSIRKYGEYLYDAAVIFAPKATSFGGSVDASALLDFIDSGHNVILALDQSLSDLNRDLALECGVDVDEEENAVVIDHLNHAAQELDSTHTVIVADKFVSSDIILGPGGIKAPVLFRGVGLATSPKNELVFNILTASPTAYSARPGAQLKDVPDLYGTSIALVVGMQARNNARVLVSGSLDLFSNKYFSSKVQNSGGKKSVASGNEKFAVEVSKWAFHERGHIELSNMVHKVHDGVPFYSADGKTLHCTDSPGLYRIADKLDFSVEIHEWTGQAWQPYSAGDVQLQFYLMSPYVIKTLKSSGRGHFNTTFQVPDVYGVFQFKIDYKRLGYTSIDLAHQIPVRPFRHNEYERFIPAAFPYYTSAFSMMAGFFVFGLAFLYHK